MQKDRKSVTPKIDTLELAPFRKLTWEDLVGWAGSRTVGRGRRYWQDGKVHDLVQTTEGRIVAWVEGEKPYATQVEWQEGHLASICTCPVRGACKHAVAVVLECLDHLAQGCPVPVAEPEEVGSS